MQGLSWSIQNIKASNHSAVINMSVGRGGFDDAVKNVSALPNIVSDSIDEIPQVVSQRVPAVVSAGNGARLAGLESPAGGKEAITAVRLDIHGVMASTSNLGAAVDVFALGVLSTAMLIV
jgi:hypothetical protein